SGLAARVRALAGASDARAVGTLTASHLGLFGHTVRGPVPAYETEYGEDTLFQKPQEMSDIAGFFSAFGLVLDPHRHERIDHISCELEFMAFLSRKEAHALEAGDAEMHRETRRAARLFLRDHLARFAPSFARRAAAVDPSGFYGRLALLCLDFIKAECDRHEAPPGPEMLRLRLPIDDGAPLACGAAEGCGVPGPCGGPEEPGPDAGQGRTG
ncbi:MAG: molecular chaperone TorD family protein, partial [Acidobacteria bacterium]|nr:molecular chaperone TorD family protein [Acidobacteriota bacterium]